VSLHKAEVFESFRVRRREFEVCGDVSTQSKGHEEWSDKDASCLLDIVFLCAVIEKVLHAAQLSSLPLSEVVFVRRASVERQRIVRVLGVLFVEDIIVAVLPVRERCLVRARLLDGLRWMCHFLNFLFGLQALLSSELAFVCSRHVHLVRVDDLGLFFEVECLLVVFDLCCGQLAVVVLTVVGEESLWVGVAHEPVRAASLSGPLVPCWQSLDCYKNV